MIPRWVFEELSSGGKSEGKLYRTTSSTAARSGTVVFQPSPISPRSFAAQTSLCYYVPLQTQVFQVDTDIARRFAEVEDPDRLMATRRRLGPDLDRTLRIDSVALTSVPRDNDVTTQVRRYSGNTSQSTFRCSLLVALVRTGGGSAYRLIARARLGQPARPMSGWFSWSQES
jgi:hypothetical protein